MRYFQSLGKYFESILAKYGRHLSRYGLDPVAAKWKQKYQAEGLNLQIKNFKPDPELWEEFRHIAFAYGLAMCRLFVVMLELEYKLWLEAGSPEDFADVSAPKTAEKEFIVNSNQNLLARDKEDILNLLSDNRSTILIRSLDYSRHRLHRICLPG
ncbi:MAG: DUF1564 family protein [Leptospiraceae bacterium]|nr:DUF1564 family protein [Leptospiraceae bacterium]